MPLVRHPGGCRIGVVIVMQLFPADQNAPRNDIRACICRVEVAVPAKMADAVDHATRPERNPDHLDGIYRDADDTKQRNVDHAQQAYAEARVLRIEVPLDPVVRRAVSEFAQRFFILCFGTVKFSTAEQNLPDAVRLRAMRILSGLALRVMLAVYCRPVTCHHTRRQPQPEAETMADGRMQLERAMRLTAVKGRRLR